MILNMSANYWIMLINEEFRDAPEAIEWLEHFKLVLPDKIIEGRNPTVPEMRNVLEKITGFSVEYKISSDNWRHWSAKVYEPHDKDDAKTIWIEVTGYTGNENESQSFSFVGDEDLIMEIARALRVWHGTSILMREGEPIAIVL